MSDESTGVSAGTLSGINLAGEEETPDAALPVEDDRTLDPEGAAPTTIGDEPAEPEPEPTPEPTPDPEPETAAKKGALSRPYVVLRQEAFEDTGKPYFEKVHEVTARNAQNAMRRAFKDLSEDGSDEATLVVIPKSMFRPTVVRLNKTERVSVSFG